MRKIGYRGKRTTKKKIVLILLLGVFLAELAVVAWKGTQAYFNSHFYKNTTIQGVDCSYLTVDKSASKISDTLNQQTITLIFENSKYEFQGEDFGLDVKDVEEISAILEKQQHNNEKHQEVEKKNNNRTYTLEKSITISEEKTRQCLESLKELQEENMIEPKDAYIKVQEDGTLAIESEILGSKIDFNEAFSYCAKSIKNGDRVVDFTSLVMLPNVFSTDKNLNETVDSVNNILATVIEFELADGSVYTLDRNTTRTWVTTDENGTYYVDLENVKTFVKELNKKVNEAIGQTMFTPTGFSNPMPLPGKLRVEVDAEKETERITTQLLESGTYTQKPIYKDGFSPQDLLLNYIEVDITRQMVWVYINGECVFSTPCVTGRPPKHSTPTGVFYLTYKTTDTYLKGYNDNGSRYSSHVNYWMPFNGGIGFHDALWQSTFGGNWYINHGSHGCVNLPLEAARTIYGYINYSMPIIVYCS